MTMGEGLLHVHKYLWPSGAGRFHHSLHPMVSAVTLSLLMDHNGITIYDHLMILPGEGLREAWFVSWSRGSQLEPNDGGAGARPRSLVPRPVSGRGGAFLGWPRHGLAWLPVITVTHNAGGGPYSTHWHLIMSSSSLNPPQISYGPHVSLRNKEVCKV